MTDHAFTEAKVMRCTGCLLLIEGVTKQAIPAGWCAFDGIMVILDGKAIGNSGVRCRMRKALSMDEARDD